LTVACRIEISYVTVGRMNNTGEIKKYIAVGIMTITG
jgi:hypothetical protein